MGMTIEEALDVLKNGTTKEHGPDAVKEFLEAKDIAIDTMHKYQKMQSDYENRLKADLVAMFTELQLEIEEMDPGCGWEGYRPTAQIIGAIQQKINALKAEIEPQESEG